MLITAYFGITSKTLSPIYDCSLIRLSQISSGFTSTALLVDSFGCEVLLQDLKISFEITIAISDGKFLNAGVHL